MSDAFGSGDAAPTGTPGPDDVLSVRDLSTRFFTEEGQINAVESVSFDLREDEILGVVGESGSGKSVTALSLVDLVETPGRITAGEVWYRDPDLAEEFRDTESVRVDGDHVDLRTVPPRVRRSLRGPSFSVIFQDPMSSFNPSITVGEQIAEAVEVQRRARANPRSTRSRTQGYGLGKYLLDGIVPGRDYTSEESMDRAIDLLGQVGIPDPEERVDEYPGQFSGGMLQRAMIAQALAGEPDVLIADEPTTALDVTIQAQILNLLKEIQADRGMSIVLITHDLGVIAEMCDRVCVMYAGEVVERGTLDSVFEDTVHPYTQGLLGSIPDVDDPQARLEPITGNVPSLVDAEMDDRCYFADRCPKAMESCLDKPPEATVDAAADHGAKCVLADREYDPADALPDDYFGAGPGGDAGADDGNPAATDGGEGE
ncbi:ABC transporter ATP-binding protein [Halorubrum sp. Atlit-26R]|uniref:ABC transporter ATP-binding protein n=1 Tax=Halorubrum sp. Atlit-26R TaxID=2282128 RepID=UPI000EF21AF0|nr:ABC transporter ATP-binding protein [Halorubrum sp. Atlit-26R]RLM76455.1 ABC transporter ATP-binding protein [Halorubrum sp. Atlit-26R]